MKLTDITSCSTAICHQLDIELINLLKRIAPSELVIYNRNELKPNSKAVHLLFQASALKSLLEVTQDANDFMTISSCYRTVAQQYLLYSHYNNKRCGIKLAGYPGKSFHQNGTAIDIPYYDYWKPYLIKRGWKWHGENDPYHFEYVGNDVHNIKELSVKAFQFLWNMNNDKQLIVDGILGDNTFKCLSQSPSEGWDKH